MSKSEKAKERLRSAPKDYTYTEAKSLLCSLGFEEFSKGKTSGSKIMFYRKEDGDKVLMHKPHPGDIMDIAAVKALRNHLMEIGEL